MAERREEALPFHYHLKRKERKNKEREEKGKEGKREGKGKRRRKNNRNNDRLRWQSGGGKLRPFHYHLPEKREDQENEIKKED